MDNVELYQTILLSMFSFTELHFTLDKDYWLSFCPNGRHRTWQAISVIILLSHAVDTHCPCPVSGSLRVTEQEISHCPKINRSRGCALSSGSFGIGTRAIRGEYTCHRDFKIAGWYGWQTTSTQTKGMLFVANRRSCYSCRHHSGTPCISFFTFTFQAEEGIADELAVGQVCKRRLEHLKEHASGNAGAVAQWRRRRLDRMLVEYFLRRGYYDAAERLAHTSDLKDLTNIGMHVATAYSSLSETVSHLSFSHLSVLRLIYDISRSRAIFS